MTDQQISSDFVLTTTTVHGCLGLLLVLLPTRGTWSKTHPVVLVVMKFAYAKIEKNG